MSQNFETCYSTLSNMKAYEGECQNFYAYFIQFSFLLPTCLSSDNNFRVSQGTLQALDSAAVLYGDHFKLHFNTALIPSVVERLSNTKQPVCDVAWRFLLTLKQVSSPFATPHLCLESQELGLMDLPPPTLLDSLIWDGFDGSPTPLLPISFSLSFGMGLMGSNGGWLFWLMVVGWFWLKVVGWLGCGCEIWDGLRLGCGCEIYGYGWVSLASLPILVVVVDVVVFVFFFFFVVVGANGGRWLILWGWSVIVGYGGWFVGVGSGVFFRLF